MAMDTVALLSRVTLLQGLDAKQRERLAKQFRERTFREGAVITAEGESGVGFFVIVEGSANVTVGREQRASLGPGDSFGEMALIEEGPRTATVVATTEMRCLALTAWEFRPFVEETPGVAWSMLQLLAKRLREAQA